jgi:hypothetical protein
VHFTLLTSEKTPLENVESAVLLVNNVATYGADYESANYV